MLVVGSYARGNPTTAIYPTTSTAALAVSIDNSSMSSNALRPLATPK
jgi:hypothetical protein